MSQTSSAQLIQDLLSAGESIDRRFGVINQYGKHLGFDCVAFGCRVPFPLSKPQVTELSSFPASWVQHYRAHNYIDKDPLVRHGLKLDEELIWTTQQPSSLYASAEQLRQEACNAGLRFGWTQGTSGNFGVRSYLTLVRESQPIRDYELTRLKPELEQLRHLSHICLNDQIATRVLQASITQEKIELTDHELRVLRLVAEGKTAHEVADISARSVDTVNFHMRNILRKLDCNNKTVAVVKALRIGLF